MYVIVSLLGTELWTSRTEGRAQINSVFENRNKGVDSALQNTLFEIIVFVFTVFIVSFYLYQFLHFIYLNIFS